MTTPARPPGFSDADATYAAIVAELDRVGDARAVDLLGRLVLLLAAEVGDHQRIAELVRRAGERLEPG